MSAVSTLRRTAVVGLTALALVGGVAVAGPADAKAGRVEKRGSCSPSGSWKIKAGPQDGKIEVEYEVEHVRSGQTWRVVIKDNGVTKSSVTRTARLRAFSVRKVIANRAGTDVISVKATNLTTGATCSGSVRY